MTAADALQTVIRPPLSSLGPPFASLEAEVMLLAIGLQESGFAVRHQDHGPARGFWQFETSGLRRSLASDPRILAEVTGLGWDVSDRLALWDGLEEPEGDHMAALLARALLWTYPHPLPALGDLDHAWVQYVKVWGPGKPSHWRWTHNYPKALAACQDT